MPVKKIAKMFGMAKKKREISAVILDFDNTLEQWIIPEAETEIAIAEELNRKYDFRIAHFLTRIRELKRGPREKSREQMTPWDWSRENWMGTIFREFGIDEDPKVYERKYWDFIYKKISLFPNVKQVLEGLKKRGIKMIMVSDSDGQRKFKEDRIDILGIRKYFDFIFTSDDVGINKPNMRLYDYAIKKAGIDPCRTLSVGDHPESDLLSCKKLGMVTVWDQEAIVFDRYISYVDYRIRDIIELLDIIDSISSGKGRKKPVKARK